MKGKSLLIICAFLLLFSIAGVMCPCHVHAVSGSMSGSTATSSGGLSGVTIGLYYATDGSAATDASGNYALAVSDASGTYSIANLTPDNYKVKFNKTGYATQWYSDATTIGTATPVTIASGTNTPNINATLQTTGSITGIVSTNGGTGPSGVTVGLYYAANGSAVSLDDVTNPITSDASGNYTFRSVAPGNYKVRFNKTGYATQWYSGANTVGTATTVTVAGGTNTPNINATLQTTGSITGMVSTNGGTGPSGVTIGLYYASDGSAVTHDDVTNPITGDASGNYTFTDVTHGDYKVKFSKTGYETQWYSGATTIGAATTVTVAGGTTTPGINVTLQSISPPTIAKAFGAASIPLNGTTGLTFTITNPNSSTTLTGIAFTDTLPGGLAVATPNGLSGDCGGGTITADQGTGVVSLSGASMAAGGSCVFSVNVTGIAAGTQNNITGNVTSVEGGAGGTASASISVNITLSITFSGNGGGTVTSTSPDSAINCIKGLSNGCSADYPVGTSVTLAAAGDWKSLFTVWSGGVTGSATPVTFTMDAGKTVTATFDPNNKAKLIPGDALFASIQDAYASVPSGAIEIQAQAWSFLEDLLFDNGTAVTLTGGMDASYNPTSGYATVKSLTVGTGSAVIGNITIK